MRRSTLLAVASLASILASSFVLLSPDRAYADTCWPGSRCGGKTFCGPNYLCDIIMDCYYDAGQDKCRCGLPPEQYPPTFNNCGSY